MWKIYEYSGCSTCRKAKKFLQAKKIDAEFIDITQNPPSIKELKKMLEWQDGNLKSLFNTSGEVYRSMKLSEKLPKLSKEEALSLLSTNGKLVKRPFALGSSSGMVGFKEEEWKKKV